MTNILNFNSNNLMAILCFFFLASCSEKQEESALVTFPDNNPTKSGVVCNPFDYYGEFHNQGVDYVMSFENEMLAMPDEMALRNFVIEKTGEFMSMVEVEGVIYDDIMSYDWESFFNLGFDNYPVALEETTLTSHEKTVLTNYFDQFENFDFTTSDGLISFLNYTENVECSLVDDPEIVNESVVFATLSTARHSANFWQAYDENGGIMAVYGKIDWRWVVGSDAIGAARGIIGGPGFVIAGAAVSSAFSIGFQSLFN